MRMVPDKHAALVEVGDGGPVSGDDLRLRDYFAAKIAPIVLSRCAMDGIRADDFDLLDEVADVAYVFADAMLARRREA